VTERGTDGPLMKSILGYTVLPMAFEGGHRWLATWAFWLLGRRDLAVRILISPMDEVAFAWSPDKQVEVGNPENDDPSLLLLFQQLKSKSLQTAKGTSEISEKLEFDFVLHNAKMFFRMGCHPLALDLLSSWSFERPFFPSPKVRPINGVNTPSTPGIPSPRRPSFGALSTSPSYSRTRRPSFMLSGHPRESMVMDMDVLAESSEPVTRISSPSPFTHGPGEAANGPATNGHADEGISVQPAPPRKVGNLMKDLKQDVQQGGMEFDMDSFF